MAFLKKTRIAKQVTLSAVPTKLTANFATSHLHARQDRGSTNQPGHSRHPRTGFSQTFFEGVPVRSTGGAPAAPVLYGVILPLRSPKTLQAYSRVWREDGSPLMAYANKQREALQKKLLSHAHVELAMRYGNPSFESVLRLLQNAGVDKLVMLPLYPQYSVTTTATSYKHLLNCLKQLEYAPKIEFIGYYPDHPAYISALAESIREHRAPRERHLLMSFHGLPQANVDRGDPYQRQCEQTASLLAKALGLEQADWSIGTSRGSASKPGYSPIPRTCCRVW